MTIEPFSTTVFTVPPSLYHRSLTNRFVGKWGVWLLLPVLACLVVSLWDFRWLFVAFIIPCVVYPMLALLVYYDKMLRPEMRAIVFPQQVAATDSTVTVTYHHADDDDTRPLPASVSIPTSALTAIDRSKGFLRLTFDSSVTPPVLLIPVDAVIS